MCREIAAAKDAIVKAHIGKRAKMPERKLESYMLRFVLDEDTPESTTLPTPKTLTKEERKKLIAASKAKFGAALGIKIK